MMNLKFALLFCLILLGFNAMLYTQLVPIQAQDKVALPTWDIFERQNLDYTPVLGNWQLQTGKAVNTAQESLALQQKPVSGSSPYQIVGKFELEVGAKAGLVFHAQTKSNQRYHLVGIENLGQAWLVTANYRNSQGILLEQRRTILRLQTKQIELSITIGKKNYQVEIGGQVVLQNIPLAYRGGFVGIWAQGQVEVRELLLRQSKPPQEQAETTPDPNVWNALGGAWFIAEGTLLEQRVSSNQDLVLLLQKAKKLRRMQVEILVTEGGGVGVVLAQKPNNLEQAVLLRFDQSGNNLFWGRYDTQAQFRGVANTMVKSAKWSWKRLELIFTSQDTRVVLNGQPLDLVLPAFNEAIHFGLVCWQSQAQLQNLRLVTEDDTETYFSP